LASQRTDKEKDFDMDMKLGPGEPSEGAWRVTPISDVVHLIFDADRSVMTDLGLWPWTAQEFEFLERQRPWERATVIVNGTPTQPYDRHTEIMVSQALH
jgi:hypothetical protein